MRNFWSGLLTAALACLAFAAMAVSRLSASLWQFTPYKSFVKCSWKAECVPNTHKLSTEKVIQIHESTHNKLFEVKNPIAKHLDNPFLGDNCYVGYQQLIPNEGELLKATFEGRETNSSEASVETNNQTETFYELSQRKNHLA